MENRQAFVALAVNIAELLVERDEARAEVDALKAHNESLTSQIDSLLMAQEDQESR